MYNLNANQKPAEDVTTPLSAEQISALENIAQANHTTPDNLVSLAVDALIAEAAHHKGWLPIPTKSNC